MIEAMGLSKRYGTAVAVDNVSFTVPAGQVTGFLGPNGAGKTTTLRLVLGLAQPTCGRVLLFGRRYRDLDRPAFRVGAVLESNDFDPGRTGADHLHAIAIAAGIEPVRVAEVLELVGLVADSGHRVRTYSLGMRQRLGLAAALLGDPDVLILDEPMNGLDPAGVRWLRAFLRAFAEEGRTVLVSSHQLTEVGLLVDRVLIVNRGRLVADASLCELTRDGETLEDAYLRLTTGGTL